MKEILQALGIVAGVFLVIWCSIIAYQQEQEKTKWLRLCAALTHGWIEREAIGSTIWSDSKGYPTGTSTQFEYYVRTPSGRRINYRDDYKAE